MNVDIYDPKFKFAPQAVPGNKSPRGVFPDQLKDRGFSISVNVSATVCQMTIPIVMQLTEERQNSSVSTGNRSQHGRSRPISGPKYPKDKTNVWFSNQKDVKSELVIFRWTSGPKYPKTKTNVWFSSQKDVIIIIGYFSLHIWSKISKNKNECLIFTSKGCRNQNS